MEFRGKGKTIETFDGEGEWPVCVHFRDKDTGWEVMFSLEKQGCLDCEYNLTDGILCLERPWLRWIIQQLAPYLGRDQELRALIEFELPFD